MDNLESQEPLEGIAIIGMSGRFPGAKTIEGFWNNLKNGLESISAFTDEELLSNGISSDLLNSSQYVKSGGVLEDIDLFDAAFFGFNPREAEVTDPQQRLFLECAWEALENAGYDPASYSGQIGTYAGVGWSSYLFNNLYSRTDVIESIGRYQTLISNDKDFLATRVSYKLNLQGPSMSVQTGCSTSLVATSLACQSLLTYQCDMALAGGVTIFSPHKAGYLYQEGGILSPDGHCRAFDAKSQGTVIGNGVGIVVLKRLEDALADGDYIHAVIKSVAINNDGSNKVGYTAPSVEGQTRAIAQAIALAEVDPETINYIETHGTGTALGDPMEITALTQVFQAFTDRKGFCAVGSVKTNIGHLDAAAGVAGLIKTVLALKHKQIPPSLHFDQPNPQIDFANSPFYVNTKLSDWKTNGTPRRAGISSFGIGGTNAHVIVEEAPVVQPSSLSRPWQLLVLSAKTSTALETATQNLATYLAENPDINLADVAYTLQVGRKAFNYRRVLTCKNREDALQGWQASQGLIGQNGETGERPIIFMFPGQGAQYPDMGRELYENEPIFKQQVDRCAELLKLHLGLDIREFLYPKDTLDSTSLQQTAIAQPALFVIEYALAQLWMAWGIRPQAAIGHSIGEYVAATIAEVMTLEDALKLVAARGQLMQQLPGGAMLAVSLSEADVQPYLSQSIFLAAVNSPKLCVVAGTTEAINRLEAQLETQEIGCRRLHTSHAFHSPMMEAIVEPFTNLVRQVNLQPAKIPFVSNVSGTWITVTEVTDPHYWARHLREPVRFAQGMAALLQQPNPIFLEVGPGRTLSTFAKQQQFGEAVIVSSIRHPQQTESDLAFLLTTLGQLWINGVQIDWSAFYAEEQRHRVPLPTYPFERQRYWIEPEPQKQALQTVSPSLSLSEEPNLSPVHARPNLANAYVAPSTPVEETLAKIWQELLGVQEIGIHDNFFDLGGDSVLGIQVSARANQAGLQLAPKQLFEYPTIAELAPAIALTLTVQAEQGIVTGEVPLTPIQQWFFEQDLPEPHHWNQAVLLEVCQALDPVLLEQAVQQLLIHHDALRLQFEKTTSGWEQAITPITENVKTISVIDVSGLPPEGQEAVFSVASDRLQASLNLTQGILLRGMLFNLGEEQPSRLLLVVHHLAVDVLSWRILIEDLQTAYQQLSNNKEVQLPPKTTSFKYWSGQLSRYAESPELQEEKTYWLADSRQNIARLPQDFPTGANTVASADTVSVTLDEEDTQTLLQLVKTTARLQIEDVLLTALAEAFVEWTGERSLLIDLEGSARDVIFEDVNLSRTVGWFTTIAPLLLELGDASQVGDALKVVKQQIRSFPNQGIGYGTWRYLSEDAEIQKQLRSRSVLRSNVSQPPAEVMFLYLGELNRALTQSSLFTLCPTFQGQTRSPNGNRSHLFEINSWIDGRTLRLDMTYSQNIHRRRTIENLAEAFIEKVRSQICALQSPQVDYYTASDFAEFKWSQWEQADLENILAAVSQSVDVEEEV